MKKLKPHKDMTGKPQPNAGRSAPNLGQKEAEVEKVSATKLTRIESHHCPFSTRPFHRLVQAGAS
jgi:hypothetical protein